MRMQSRWSLVSLSFVGALALLIGASPACGGKTSSGDAPAAQTSPSASQVVGAAGGTVTTSDGAASVVIPQGALSSDVTVTIDKLTDVTIPGRQLLSDAFELGPDGTTFAKPITVTLKTRNFTASFPPVEMSVGVGSVFSTLPTTVSDGFHVSATTTHFSTYAVTVVDGALGNDPPDATVTPPNDSNCLVTCEGPENIDGGIGCHCGVTCNGIAYDLQCVCGACTCYQDGVAGKTATLSTSACDTGGMGLVTTYFNTCGYPGAKNGGGAGGPVSNDAGGSCP